MPTPPARSRTRLILLALAWLLAMIGLYGGLTALELYWNLADWYPRLDLPAGAVLLWILVALASIFCLVRASTDPFTRGLSLVICLLFLALALYLLPAEPLQSGFLGRQTTSPLWYRGARAGVLLLPGAFWLLGLRRSGLSRNHK